MKVYVLDSFFSTGVEYAAQHAELVLWDDPQVKNWHEDADGVMVRMTPIRADDLARAKKLRVIAKQGVGVDTIDLAAARARAVTVCRTPGVNKEAVAELALALALSVTRRVAEFDRQIRSGAIVERSDFLGLESWQKTVGVVGMGNIGTLVAAQERLIAACRRHGKFAGCGGNRDVARQVDLVRKGCLFLTTQSDIGFLSAAASSWTKGIREGLKA